MQPFLLVVDDQKSITVYLEKALTRNGYRVATAGSGSEALLAVEKEIPDLVLLDLQLPDKNGLVILQQLKDHFPHLCVIIITSISDVSIAVKAIKAGAWDYVEKPINMAKLMVTIEKGLESSSSLRELHLLRRRSKMFSKVADFVPARSPEMEKVYEMIRRVSAASTTTVMIDGESGVGKDMIASLLHAASDRAKEPFLDMNCASLPEQLLESELFGHEKGAFTDAVVLKPGLMEMAHKGTLFLDEIGEMPLAVQGKFLRVLERMSFRRLGGVKDIKVDVRIITATNSDLKSMIDEGRFREDLYYRLEVIKIHVPSMRKRPEDIEGLAQHFANFFGRRMGKKVEGFSDEAIDEMKAYHWPGNIRELKNMTERAVLLSETPLIGTEYLGLGERHGGENPLLKKIRQSLMEPISDDGIPMMEILGELESELIRNALSASGGNKSRTARLLGLKRDKLRYRLKANRIEEGNE